jgi:hypothetical protein
MHSAQFGKLGYFLDWLRSEVGPRSTRHKATLNYIGPIPTGAKQSGPVKGRFEVKQRSRNYRFGAGEGVGCAPPLEEPELGDPAPEEPEAPVPDVELPVPEPLVPDVSLDFLCFFLW